MENIDAQPISVQCSHFIQTENTTNFWLLLFSMGNKMGPLASSSIKYFIQIQSLTNLSILYPLKTQGKQRFSGGTKWKH